MDKGIIDNGATGKGLLFVISSVSGGGKTTVIRQVMSRLEDLRLSVSHTTREPRKGETDGKDYYFVSTDLFDKMIEKEEFLEWAGVYEKKYGTSRKAVFSITDKGFDALLDIDVQGAMQVRDNREDAILIFIVPPGEEEQERRLRNRGTEDAGEIATRLEAARQELAFMGEYDYSVLNDDIEEAADAVLSIIRAERCRNRGVTTAPNRR